MTTEALWSQLAGVSYSAQEDRRVIGALASPGVVTGLNITAGTGRNVNVTAGTGIVSDGGGGAYVAYTTVATPLTITASATESVYLTVNTTTGLTSVTSGPVPSSPYLVLGSVKATSTGLDAAYGTGGISMANRERAYPPAMAGTNGQALYLPLTGGVVNGPVQATRLVVPGLFAVGGTDTVPTAPEGIKLGGLNPTARHYAMVTAKTPTGGENVIGSGQLESIRWNTPTVSNNVTDYARDPFTASTNYQFRAGVEGYYMVSGHVNFEHNNADDNSSDVREVRLSVYTDGNSDPEYEVVVNERRCNYRGSEQCPLSGMVRMRADQHLRIRAYQNSSGQRNINGGRALFRLLQAN